MNLIIAVLLALPASAKAAEPAFHTAAEADDITELKGWLGRVPVDMRCEGGWTALTHAAAAGSPGAVKELLKAKADVRARGRDMNTPLIAAALFVHPDIVDLLLAAGADPSEADKNGDTALMKVCSPPTPPRRPMAKMTKIGKALLAAGADVGVKNEAGLDALMMASASCNPRLVKALLEAKADPDLKSPNGKTALTFARQGKCSAVEALLAAVLAKGEDEEPPLHAAAQKGEIAKLQEELKTVPVDLRCKDGWTALTHAAAFGRVEVIKELIKAKADLNARGKDMNTPLIAASMFVKPESTEVLLAAGAAVDLVDDWGGTALLKVCTPPSKGRPREGMAKIGKALLAAGAATAPRDQEGGDALARAAESCNPELVEALLQAKADPNATPLGPRTSKFLECCCESKDSIKAALRAAGWKH